MKKLLYLCPVCNHRLEVHCRGEIFEIKKLGCVKCGVVMYWKTVENADANSKTKRVKVRG